jgi:DNA-binding beta-propeller fold protein YncE
MTVRALVVAACAAAFASLPGAVATAKAPPPPVPPAALQLPPPFGCLSGVTSVACLPDREGGRFLTDVALSADGRNAYAVVRTWARGGRVVAYARDPRTGDLARLSGPDACFARGARDGCATARGLVAPTDVVASADGANVYVLSENPRPDASYYGSANRGREAVVAFTRDPSSGRLTPAGCVSDRGRYGCTAAWNVFGAHGLFVSRDGRSLYLPSSAFELAVLRRDRRTGRLTPMPGSQACISAFLAPQCASPGHHEEDMSVSGAALSPDGRHLYLFGDGLAVMRRNPRTGRVRRARDACAGLGTADGICRLPGGLRRAYEDAAAIAFADGGRTMYVGGDSGSVAVVGVRRDRLIEPRGRAACVSEDAERCTRARYLVPLQDLVTGGDGRHVYEVGGGGVAILRRTSGGGLRQSRHLRGACIGSYTGCLRAQPLHDLTAGVVAPDGRELYVASGRAGAVAKLERNPATGALHQPEASRCVAVVASQACDLTLPRLTAGATIVLSPDGANAYVSQQAGPLLVLARDAATGALRPVAGRAACVSTAAAGCTDSTLGTAMLSSGEVAVSPDGRSVYVVDSSFDAAIWSFRREPATGALTELPHTEGQLPSNAAGPPAIAPDGRDVYLAGPGSLLALRRDVDGALHRPTVPACFTGNEPAAPPPDDEPACFGPVRGMPRAYSGRGVVTVTPDGRHVLYASTAGIAVLERHGDTGLLAQPNGEAGCLAPAGADGCGHVRRLGTPTAIAVAPDGRYVYVANMARGILVLRRDATTGALSTIGDPGCVGPLDSGCETVRGYRGGERMAMPADGRFIATATGLLVRDAASGALAPGGGSCLLGWPPGRCVLPAAESTPTTGNREPLDVAVAPDGRHIYVLTADAILVLAPVR